MWLTVSVICLAIWVATGADYFWPMWPMFFIGLTVALHGVSLLTGKGEDDATGELGRST